MEEVVFVKNGEEFSGEVLGVEKEYFWLLVISLREVYLGHPSRVFERSGRKYFEIFDRCQSIDNIFDKHGRVATDLFFYSRDPEELTRMLKMYRLVNIL
ncbi:hypothetical protein [Marinobacter antarcticus]|nr:hypothetical protein [Marinobacter antarcticus]